MSEEITKKDSSLPTTASINVHAEGNGTAVGYNDAIYMNIIMADGKKSQISADYFNLIIGYDPFEKDYILVDKSRALTEYIQDDVKDEFGGWTPEKIDKIKKLPAILAQEWDRTDEQLAVFAFIRDIKVQENGIKVYFQRYFPIPFNFLREHLDDLAVYLFEIYRTHWTIKNIDLMDVLQEAGLFPGR